MVAEGSHLFSPVLGWAISSMCEWSGNRGDKRLFYFLFTVPGSFVPISTDGLCLLALVFESVILHACATLCATAVVFLTIAPPTHDHPYPRRALSHVAAATATAATEEACPNPSPETTSSPLSLFSAVARPRARVPGGAIVSIGDKRIENTISIRMTPAFLPHQRPVSMRTPCAGRCTSVDRFSIRPM